MRKLLFIICIVMSANIVNSATHDYTFTHTHTITSDDVDRLIYDIQKSTIAQVLENIDADGVEITTTFRLELSQSEQNLVEYLIVNPSTEDMNVEDIVPIDSSKALKHLGFTFVANAMSVTTYTFTMPYRCQIFGGCMNMAQGTTGDRADFVSAYGTPYEYKFMENRYVVNGFEYPSILDNNTLSEEIPVGMPMAMIYDNVGSSRTIVFEIFMKVLK